MTRHAANALDARIFLLALVAYAAGSLYLFGYTLDDAAITLRYSYNLAHSGVLSFNVTEHVLGTTTPAWALLMTPIMCLVGDGDPLPYCKLASFAFGAASVWTFVRASRHWQLWVRGVFIGLATLSTTFAAFALSAMEFSFSIWLLMSFVLAYVEIDRSRRLASMTWLALVIVFTRPDFAIIAGLLLAHALWLRRTEWRAEVTELVAPVALGAGCVVAMWLYYGSVVPLSFAAKILNEAREPGVLAGLRRVSAWGGLQGFAVLYAIAGYVVLAVPAAQPARGVGRSGEHRALVVAAIAFLAYFVKQGGSIVMDHAGRYYFPGYLLLAWASCAALDARLGAQPHAGAPGRWLRGFARVVLTVSVALLLPPLYVAKHYDKNLFTKVNRSSMKAYAEAMSGAYIPMGKFIAANYASSTKLLIRDAGFVPFYSKLDDVLDYWSLNEPRIVACKRACVREVVAEYDPDIVVQGREVMPNFRKRYKLVKTFTGGERTLKLYEKRSLGVHVRSRDGRGRS